jgi:hypothetical protein
VTARTQADAEFLAREIASVRLSLAGMPTADDLNDAVERLAGAVERLAAPPRPDQGPAPEARPPVQ